MLENFRKKMRKMFECSPVKQKVNILIYLEKIKNNILKKENIYFIVLTIIIIYLDRISKEKVIENFNESVFYFNDYVNIDLIWNNGIGFGLLSTNSSLIYNLVTVFY